MSRPVYMTDVAREAGVHKSTVSLALRNHPRIPAETRERVRLAAEKLGYRPNPMVTALMQLKKASRPLSTAPGLAYVTAHPGRYDWRQKDSDLPDFLPGAARQAHELGFKLNDYWLTEPGMTGGRMSQILRARGITGIIVAPLPPGAHRLDLAWENFCVVSLGVHLTTPLVHRVAHNHFHTMKMAVARCRAAGCTRIGVYLAGQGYRVIWEHWIGAYLGEQVQGRKTVAPCLAEDASPEVFWKWFRATKPDAIIFGRSPVPEWLEAGGVKVPDDVSLVNLHVRDPKGWLAGVYYDPAITGGEAVNQLVALINRNEVGPPAQAHDFLIHGHWVQGQSLRER